MILQERTARKLAVLSFGSAALCVLMFAIGEIFFWGRSDLHPYENVMEIGVLFMAVSAMLGIAAFIRAGDGGVARPVLVKWNFAMSMVFVLLLIAFLIAFLGIPPIT